MAIVHLELSEVKYVKGSSSVVHGYKGGSQPSGRCIGGNGTFRVIDSPIYNFTFKREDTDTEVVFNLYGMLKNIAFEQGISRITQRVRDDIEYQIRMNGAELDTETHKIILPNLYLD